MGNNSEGNQLRCRLVVYIFPKCSTYSSLREEKFWNIFADILNSWFERRSLKNNNIRVIRNLYHSENIDLRKIEVGFNHLKIGHTRLCYKANVVEGFQSRYLLSQGLFKEA